MALVAGNSRANQGHTQTSRKHFSVVNMSETPGTHKPAQGRGGGGTIDWDQHAPEDNGSVFVAQQQRSCVGSKGLNGHSALSQRVL